MAASVLIIGPVGRLRDGLRAILRSFPGISEVFSVEDFSSGFGQVAENRPSIIIVDADDSFEDDCILLKQLHSRHERILCLLIANSMQQAASAKQAGVDAVLLCGFSTSTLYQTLVDLKVIPESVFSGEPVRLNQQQETAVQLAQRH